MLAFVRSQYFCKWNKLPKRKRSYQIKKATNVEFVAFFISIDDNYLLIVGVLGDFIVDFYFVLWNWP